MSNYKANLRDIEFNLFEALNVLELYGKTPFSDTTKDDATAILDQAAKFATEVIAETYEEGDRLGCVYEEGKVSTPPSFKEAMEKFVADSWQLRDVAREDGGMELPESLVFALNEMITAANPALYLYIQGADIGNIIKMFGTDEQVRRFCPSIYSGKWSGTMVLTEPDAGSDVGAIRSKARKVEGDLYEVEGGKRFITGGEQDLTENIIHLVLARIEGAAAGAKGLSLFIIPKIWVNEDGTMGESNDVACAGIEHKMGLKASATCQMSFGENGKCRGFLLGGVEHRGIHQMFALMNHGRTWTGTKAMGLASTGYLNALAYTRERVQGQDMKQMMDKSAPRVPIIRHPDVKRMLLNQKSKVEAMRAIILMVGALMDRVKAAGGKEIAPDEYGRIEILTPLLKSYCTEEAVHCI